MLSVLSSQYMRWEGYYLSLNYAAPAVLREPSLSRWSSASWGGFLPSWRAARLDPVQAIRQL